MTYANQWRRLYSYARLTSSINPNLAGDVMLGRIKPHHGMSQFVEKHYNRHQVARWTKN